MTRTQFFISDHINSVVDHMTTYLKTLDYEVPVGFGERPVGSDKKHLPPPYLVVSFMSGGSNNGPISDSEADVLLRILLLATGNTAKEATVLHDITHNQMIVKENFSINNRILRTIRTESPSDGIYRDDDDPSPIFYTRHIYLLDTTPS